MAIFGAGFQIGQSALAAYQTALTITGQNIANVGNPNYTRQSGHLVAQHGGLTMGGMKVGTGVNVSQLERHIDESLQMRLRLARGTREGAAVTYSNLSRIELMYNELTLDDLSTQLSDFFASFASLQTDPLEISSRELVIAGAETVIDTMQRQRQGLFNQISDLNTTAAELTARANEITEEIASLNAMIVTEEATGLGGAGALRDRRDTLLGELAEMMDIHTREYENGVLNVFIGSEPLVDFDRSRGLTTEVVYEDGLETVSVRFADNNGNVIMSAGILAATVNARDVQIRNQLDQLDQLARSLIYEINRVHSTGRGLIAHQSLTGTYALADTTAALNSTAAGLPFPVENGTFQVRVQDQVSGKTTTRQIAVDLDGLNNDDMSLDDLIAALDNIPNLSASATADGRLQLATADGYEVYFAEDNSGALAALGIGGFFEGTTASTMAVRSEIQEDARLIAASQSGAPGDGSNAGRIAALADAASTLLNDHSAIEFHQGIISELATETAAALNAYDAADVVYSSLAAQRESISGVSLDEEAINLTKYQQSFQGAARYISVLESLSDEVLAIVG